MPNQNLKHEKCPTCGSNTTEYEFTFSLLDAKLLLGMAHAVRENKKDHPGWPFKAVNQVHLPTLAHMESNVQNRKTITSKLGLIAKYLVNGKQKQGMWVITARGWAALRGEKVPARIREFRNQITERFGDETTLGAALRTYPDSAYNSAEWFSYGENRVPGMNPPAQAPLIP